MQPLKITEPKKMEYAKFKELIDWSKEFFSSTQTLDDEGVAIESFSYRLAS